MKDLKRFSSNVSSLSNIQDRCSNAGAELLKSSDDFSIIIKDDRLSDESLTLITSYNETFRRLFKNTMMLGSLSIEPSQLDYSLLINPLAKVLETELNLSLMPWIKKNSKQFERDLCDEKGNTRNSFTLGEICVISTRLLDCECFPKEVVNPKEFIHLLKKIRDLRNSASHTGCTNRADFEEFHSVFSNFITLGYLDAIMSIKRTLLGY